MHSLLAIVTDNEAINSFMVMLQAAVVAVTTALCFVCKLLWTRSEKCEADRIAMRLKLEDILERLGIAKGELSAFDNCPNSTCPFQQRDDR